MYQSIGFINRQSPEDLQLTSDGSLFVPKCIVQYLTAYQINGIRTINRKLKECNFFILNDESELGKIIQVIGLISAYCNISNADAKHKTCLIMCNSETRLQLWSYYFDIFTNIKTTRGSNEIERNTAGPMVLIQNFNENYHMKPIDYLVIDFKSTDFETLPHDALRNIPANKVIGVIADDISKNTNLLQTLLYIGKIIKSNTLDACEKVCDIYDRMIRLKYCRSISLRRNKVNYQEEIDSYNNELFMRGFEEWREKKSLEEMNLSSTSTALGAGSPVPDSISIVWLDTEKSSSETINDSPQVIEATPLPRNRSNRRFKTSRRIQSRLLCARSLQNKIPTLSSDSSVGSIFHFTNSSDVKIMTNENLNTVIEINSENSNNTPVVPSKKNDGCQWNSSPDIFENLLDDSPKPDSIPKDQYNCSDIKIILDETDQIDEAIHTVEELLPINMHKRKSEVFEITTNDAFDNQFRLNSVMDITTVSTFATPNSSMIPKTNLINKLKKNNISLQVDEDDDEIPSSQNEIPVERYRGCRKRIRL